MRIADLLTLSLCEQKAVKNFEANAGPGRTLRSRACIEKAQRLRGREFQS
jgi:hypothetical protein